MNGMPASRRMLARRSEAEARINFMVVTRDPDKVGAGRRLVWSVIVASERSSAGNGVPPTPCFLAKSAETIENKGVVFFVSAKKCKRVRNDMKIKEIGRRHVGRLAGLETGFPLHPPSRWKECASD